MARYFSVKNWEQFQHYKDRAPPWIKLHTALLDDYDFAQLPDATKGQLICIWILASKMGNRIPFDAPWVAKRINASVSVDLAALYEAGFIVDATPEAIKGRTEDWASRHVSDVTRQAVLDRDGNRCRQCESVDALEIDHVLPISRGGTGDIENLQVLCRSCNRKKRANIVRAEAAQPRSTPCADPAQPRSLETETETQEQAEVPKATPSGAAAPLRPIDLNAEMWRTGTHFLKTTGGKSDADARKLIGQWRKRFSEVDLIAAFASAEAKGTADPIGYITAVLQGRGRDGNDGRTARQRELDERRAEQADAFRAAVGGGMGPGGRA